MAEGAERRQELRLADRRRVSAAYRQATGLAAIAAAGLGLAWCVAPERVLALWGVEQSSSRLIVEHRFGALFIGFAAVLWFARRIASSADRRRIVDGVLVGLAAMLAVNAVDFALGRVGVGLLPGVALQIVLLVLFVRARRAERAG